MTKEKNETIETQRERMEKRSTHHERCFRWIFSSTGEVQFLGHVPAKTRQLTPVVEEKGRKESSTIRIDAVVVPVMDA